MIRRTLLAACLAAAAACASRHHPAAPQPDPGVRVDTVDSDYDEDREALHAAGLAPLDSVVLPPGTREVRIWTGYALGYPHRLYRIRERRGAVSGDLLLYWPGTRDHSLGDSPGETYADLVRNDQRGRCHAFARTPRMEACHGSFRRRPDWARVLRRMESLGIWTLQDPATLPYDSIVTLDGWGMWVEVRDGPSFRTYAYPNPQSHPSWRDAPRAIEIARVLDDSVAALLRSPDVLRTYRGVTTGAYHSAITLCDGRSTWEFHDELRSMAGRVSIPLPPAGTAGLYYVEVRGDATPEWLARQWESKFPRVLQPARLLVVTPWTGRECRDHPHTRRQH
jgi:hypothetical protein